MEIKWIECDIYFQHSQLECHLKQKHMAALEKLRDEAYEKRTYKCKERQKRSRNCQEVCKKNMWVHNYSSKKLSLIERNVLAKGLNVAPTPKCIPVRKIFASVEDGLRKVI